MINGSKKRAFSFHDVMMYVAFARKHLRLMCLLMCLALVAGLLSFVFSRPVYYSKSLLRVVMVARPIDTDKLYADGRMAALTWSLNSGPVLERTAKALGVTASAREIRSSLVLKSTFNRLDDGNVEMEIWPTRNDWAQKWPAALVREFLAYRQERRIAERQKIIDSYSKEMQEVSGKMDETLDEKFARADQQQSTQFMISYANIRGVPAELIRLTSLIDEMGRVRMKIQDPDLDAIAKLSLISTLKDKANLFVGQQVKMNPEPAPDSATPGSDGGNDFNPDPSATELPATIRPADRRPEASGKSEVVIIPALTQPAYVWQDLEKRLQGLKKDWAEKSKLYLPGHQKMQALKKQLDETTQSLNVELDVAQNRLGLEYQDLLNRRSEMEAKLPEYESVNKRAMKMARDSNIFNATQLPWTNFYSDMKRRLADLDYAGERERLDVSFAGLLDTRENPVSPNRSRVLLLSLFVGLMLAIVLPFSIEYLDHTITDMEQVESTFQLRALGIVPKLADEYSSSLPPAGIAESEGTNLLENFRVIRTNLLSMGNFTKPPHVIMVTSAMPREGKTVVSSNLAISFAQTGARTLLIDTDLRRGRMHRLFGYRKSPGLSEVLLGDQPLEAALRPTSHENLTILSAGKHLTTGTELLGSGVFSEVLLKLRERFDRIIIDTPPVLGLSEASLMQPLVDGTVFVIWSGRTPIRNMKAAIDLLQSNGACFYGFVMNRLDLTSSTNYYQYYYYSHDYYYHTSTALENV